MGVNLNCLYFTYIDATDRLDDITCARKSELGGFLCAFLEYELQMVQKTAGRKSL
jgi:hypothetical protein